MRVVAEDVVRLVEPLAVRCCSTVLPVGAVIHVVGRNTWVKDQPRKQLRTAVVHLAPEADGRIRGGYHVVRTRRIHGEVL